jgi:hypothetical protein
VSTFDDFKRELALYVEAAVARGIRISASDKATYCPLGCIPGDRPPSFRHRPVSCVEIAGTSQSQRVAFACAFDGSAWAALEMAEYPDFAELGREYRARFP